MLTEGLSFDQYLERPGISRSDLVLFRRGPNYYKYFSQNKPSKALVFGTLLHQAILEPDTDLVYTIKPSGLNLNTKEGRAWKAKANGPVLTEQEDFDLKAMSVAFKSHPVASEYIKRSINEATIDFEVEGVKCKARPDIITNMGMIVDLKSTRHLNARQMGYEYRDRGYDLQAGFYTLAASYVLKKEITDFVLVYILKSAPYEVMVKYTPRHDVLRSQDEVKQLINEFKMCVETNTWESRIPVEPTPINASFIELETPMEDEHANYESV